MRYIYLFVLVVFAGCSTLKKTGPSSDIGLWQGKVLMVEKKTNHKKWVNVTWASDSSVEKMRIDISAVMDFPVATYIQTSTKAHLWLFSEQKYFHSDDGRKLFQYLTKINIDPKVFYSLLGMPRAPSKDWDCQKSENQFDCVLKSEKMSLAVENSESDLRVIKIDKGDKSLRLRLNRAKVEVDEDQFNLLPTSQFKTIEI